MKRPAGARWRRRRPSITVTRMRIRFLWAAAAALVLAACGPKSSSGSGEGDTLPDDLSKPQTELEPPPKPQTELERRQAAACEQLGPRITECAVEDARAKLPPEKLAELDLENTAPVHTREFIKNCVAQPMSSRQVRVYEVCQAEETECGPLLACLEHADPDHADADATAPE